MSASISTAAPEGLWLGLDTGGTFTDAVLLAGGRRVLATAKALTTHSNLAIGIGHAIRAVFDAPPVGALPHGALRGQVSLVSVSTTLATNAVVENRFGTVCTLLIGFDDAMAARAAPPRHADGVVVRVRGGHGATGEESAALDEAGIEAAVNEYGPRIEAFAVAANFSVRNPAHEVRARQIIRGLSPKPVTCACELSSKLDAPRRALTATLNARLTPQIRHLIEALSRVLALESIDAPLMIVKGDGSLMKADLALEYPVETILSGPAASVVGAGFLTGLEDFVVCDMGGTTTDIAVVAGGRPVVRAEGALVGDWRTMVEAVDVRTSGLGGDSEVYFDRHLRLAVGPRKALPLSLMAQSFPESLKTLRTLAGLARIPEYATQFAFRTPDGAAPVYLEPLERRLFDSLQAEPCPVSSLVRNPSGLKALRHLANAGLATLAAFTPSDAMHVLERQHGWRANSRHRGTQCARRRGGGDAARDMRAHARVRGAGGRPCADRRGACA
jgi:N-methylhydantoinase A/oxoprolinase/acetone carboxylase beta subunit